MPRYNRYQNIILLLPAILSLLLMPPIIRAGEDKTVIEDELLTNRRNFPIQMESSRVGIWENDREIVFIFTSPVEIRQADMRVLADSAVVRATGNTEKTARVSIYAQGTGGSGETAENPALLMTEDHQIQSSALHLSLETLQGLSWECPHYRIEDINRVRLYRHAAAVLEKYGEKDSYSLDRLPMVRLEPLEPRDPVFDTLRADTPRFFTREEEGKIVAVYMGNVYGTYENIDISADIAILWLDIATGDYEIYARGDVILRRAEGARNLLGREGLETLRADRIYINPSAERGLADAPEMRVKDRLRKEIYVIRGRRAYILDRKNLLIRDAGATDCPHGIPHYEFKAGTLQFIQQPSRLFASGWNVNIVAGEKQVPLFWLPYIGMNLDRQTYLLKSISAGTSSGFGTILETRWAPSDLGFDPDWLDEWSASIDYFEKRGTGIGTDLRYEFGGEDTVRHKGSLKSYYIHDRAEEDSLGRVVPQADRSRLQMQHRTDWTPNWRTDLEYAHLSDHAFLREYFTSDFISRKAPETQIHTRYRSEHLWSGLQVKKRTNRFMTQREARPGLEMHLLDTPIGPFAYDAMLDAGLYEFKLSREDAFRIRMAGEERSDPPEVTRMHTDHKLSLPMRIGFIKLDPHLRALATYASKGAEREPDGDFRGSTSRTGTGWGVRAAADFSRMYNVGNRKPFDINRLRHIVTPFAEAERIEVDTDSNKFIQMRGEDPWPRYGRGPRERDDWIDAIDDTQIVRLGLRQRLQTKRNGMNTEWIRLDVATVFRSEDSVAVVDDDDYVEVDFAWKLTPALSLTSENNRFSLDDGFHVFNCGVRWQPSPELNTSVRYNNIKDRTSSITAGLDMELSDRYALSVYERYEFDRGGTGREENMRTDITLSRWFHKWLLQVEFFYEAAGEGDRGMMIRFSPRFLDPMGRREGIAIR